MFRASDWKFRETFVIKTVVLLAIIFYFFQAKTATTQAAWCDTSADCQVDAAHADCWCEFTRCACPSDPVNQLYQAIFTCPAGTVADWSRPLTYGCVHWGIVCSDLQRCDDIGLQCQPSGTS